MIFLHSARALILFAAIAPLLKAQAMPADWVHPTVGTSKEGQTYPATGVPFAMTHWTPQTRAGEIKCIAPYYFTDEKIQGFRGSHFISGSCVPDYGSFTLMAGVGTMKTSATARASSFDRATEHASPYAYAVDLKDAGVRAEITGTTRSGMMRFTPTQAGNMWVLVDSNARGGDGWVQVDEAHQQITGEVPVRREYAGSGRLAGFSSYFVVEFNKPFKQSGTWVGSKMTEGGTKQTGDGLPLGVTNVPRMMTSVGGASAAAQTMPTSNNRPGFGTYVRFPELRRGDAVIARIGTSFVSVDEARKNLRAEIPGWNFDAIRDQAKTAWNKALGGIEVKDNIPARTVFYTALYHALLHPRTYSDLSGSYPRFASNYQVEYTTGFTYYDDFSMWDTFRAQHPLLTILDPARNVQMVQSLIAKGEQGGYLPIFPAWSSYTSEMVGDHVSVTIIDAYQKGLRGFDIEKAYTLMRKNAMEIPQSREEYRDGKGRRGLPSYLQYGYIPLEDHIDDAFHKNEQVSRTLEYAFDDAILGDLAATLGKSDDAAMFHARGENWRKVFDPETKFSRGRSNDGSWVSPFDPARKYTWITEGLPWQYTFFVPQNVQGLAEAMGGDETFVKRLDGLFDGKFYDHGNEPSHHIAYLYDAGGAPWKTQREVRSLMESEYRDGPDGLAGNDDAGQMSAWYVLSALGFYQVVPGRPEYWLGSPRFDDATIHLPGGKILHVFAPGAGSGKVYVRSAALNGKSLSGYKLKYSEIMNGGTLRFQMSDALQK